MHHTKKTLSSLLLAGMALVILLGALPAQAATPNLRPAITPGPLNHRDELRATVRAKAKLTQVELRIDNKKVQPWVRAHAGWTYSIRYPLTKLAVGMHAAKLTVRDQKNRSSQHQWQFQKLAQLALTVNKTSVQPGETVTLSGQGFTPGTAVVIGVGGQNTGVGGNYGTATADSRGAFNIEVTLDTYPDGSPLHAGTITLVAHTADYSQKASAQLQIVDRVPVAPSDLRLTSLTKGATSAEPMVAGLQWRDNAATETGFRIQATYTRLNGGTDTQVWTVPANATTAKVSFVAGGINPVSTACFTVTAFNSEGASLPSNGVYAAL